MKAFLLEMFRHNRDANVKMVEVIRSISANEEMLRHLSHLANCQYKWLERIISLPQPSGIDWWTPVYTEDELIYHFDQSTAHWVDYLSGLAESEIEELITYAGYNDTTMMAKVKDIALQLIFHSFHHRAQIQVMIRAAGHTPPSIDFIRSKVIKKEAT